ncbi:MAG: pyridoxamine 5'-phosphate oxidase family protein [Clostridia bacterium]|nr:pyridoxamine 5'-phosphate oxidase family protein [Clostridia bacterium]
MFRKMRRFKQQISEEECIAVLKSQPRGVLSVIGDDGYPYGLPIDYWYCEDNGHICFHGAKEGHKIDAIKKCDKVSFCVYDDGYRCEGEWALNIKSVIVFGRIKFVEDYERTVEISRNLCLKFTDDQSYIEKEIENFSSKVQCLEIVPEHITGKLVNES